MFCIMNGQQNGDGNDIGFKFFFHIRRCFCMFRASTFACSHRMRRRRLLERTSHLQAFSHPRTCSDHWHRISCKEFEKHCSAHRLGGETSATSLGEESEEVAKGFVQIGPLLGRAITRQGQLLQKVGRRLDPEKLRARSLLGKVVFQSTKAQNKLHRMLLKFARIPGFCSQELVQGS